MNSKEWKTTKIVSIHIKSNSQQLLTGLRVVVMFSNVSFQTRNPAYFSGCIADRDFTPGVSVLDNIVKAIHSSYKVILVLTEFHFCSRFEQHMWCNG
jgi:hypothetical protein